MKDEDFHPDDPTKKLWKRLLRSYPGKGTYPLRPISEKRDKSEKLLVYYKKYKHPRTGDDAD